MSNEVLIECAEYVNKPFQFVMFAFPWGVAGTILAKRDGPELWQKKILIDLGNGLIDFSQAIKLATTSGHGVGKSALVAWLLIWAMATFENTKGIVTANTENQLKTKTWAELTKWHQLSICREYFKMTATKYYSADPDHENTWKIDMVPWSERNTEAFAGLHNQGKRIIVVFDEGSGIPDIIWEVTEGALTDSDTQIIWAVFGNPTRNKGRFRECFDRGKFANRWHSIRVDSRDVSFTNRKQIDEWIEDYGEDSDFVRVRVRGVFPRVDAESFISYDRARDAVGREVLTEAYASVVLGVDVGRNADASVIYPRCGLDGLSRPFQIYRDLSIVELAKKVIMMHNMYHAQYIFIDCGYVGGGLIDILRTGGFPVISVDFGSKADGIATHTRGINYANKRAEIWGEMREWLKTGTIPKDIQGQVPNLLDELTGPNTAELPRSDAILLESKRDMRRRGVPSPNVADALACTFAFPDYIPATGEKSGMMPIIAKDYDPFSLENIYA